VPDEGVRVARSSSPHAARYSIGPTMRSNAKKISTIASSTTVNLSTWPMNRR
jgi:hypothetical protein